MTENKVRSLLALLVIGGFLFVNTAIIAVILIGLVDAKSGLMVLKDTIAIFSGVVGIIIGYYFGKRESDQSKG